MVGMKWTVSPWLLHGCSLACILALVLQIFSLQSQLSRLKSEEDVMKNANLMEYNDQPVVTNPDEAESHDIFLEKLKSSGSAVMCFGQNHTTRICQFRNLCYNTEKGLFLFFHGAHTVLSGVPEDKFDPALLDLSGVADHNAQYFNYVDVLASAASDILVGKIHVVREATLIFNRFHPDNIMHVFHDDLLPMFHTLRLLSAIRGQPMVSSPTDLQVIFADRVNDTTEFDHLYGLFTENPPLHISSLVTPENSLGSVCFTNVYVGLNRQSTWYQYGFNLPQGPLPHMVATAYDIKLFTNYLSNSLLINRQTIPNQSSDGLFIVVTRKKTRLILNELELSLGLANRFKKTIVSVSMETHSVIELIKIFKKAAVVVGMHGSLLILSMFAPVGTVFVELFPYAVSPGGYTPYRTLAHLPGMGIVYRSWRNWDQSMTVTHPMRSPQEGGITHLDLKTQERILNSEQVPPHLCCSDPEWLFRAFQDTVVNVGEVLDLVEAGLTEIQEMGFSRSTSGQDKLSAGDSRTESGYTLYPGQVEFLHCKMESTAEELSFPENEIVLEVHWDVPWNLKYIGKSSVQYEIWIQNVNADSYKSYIVQENYFILKKDGLSPSTGCHVWVRTLTDGFHGRFAHTMCQTN